MSPEQALGESIDQRSDLFTVGILLYEMATGQRPFNGASDAAMYDALLHHAPPAPTTVRDGPPAEVDLIVRRALEKDRELRYQSAADLGAELKRLQRPPAFSSVATLPPVRLSRTRAWQAAAIAALLLAAVLAVALVTGRPPATGAPTTRFVLGPPPDTVFTPVGLVPAAVTVSVSPDGRQLLYRANRPGDRGRLWLRSLDSVEAIAIDDTEGGIFPFWSSCPTIRRIPRIGARMADSSSTRSIRRPTTTISSCCGSATVARRHWLRRDSASTKAAYLLTAAGWRTRQRRPDGPRSTFELFPKARRAS